MKTITHYWYQTSLHPFLLPLLPLSWLFKSLTSIRRLLYRLSLLKRYHFPVPIVIVGNITVGGTGKTPFVIWLVQYLQAQGLKPGVVSRGMGSSKLRGMHWVEATDTPLQVGDEALLIKHATKVPFVICRQRARAVAALLKESNCNVIISDDGLQHYQLARSIEIAMVDGVRLFGNGQLLPAGPLREPVSRLKQVDFVVYNAKEPAVSPYIMTLMPSHIVSLCDVNNSYSPADFPWKRLHAVAGIGHPERFFNDLKKAGFDIIPHVFPDHYHYRKQDFAFNDMLPIIMTTKDAVKCQSFADQRFWCQHIHTNVSDIFAQHFFQKLSAMEKNL